MTDQRLLDILNQSIARELQVSIQYMWHHVMALGLESPAIKDITRNISIVEMKHAEEFAERLHYLGGVPTTQPSAIAVGGDLRKMIQDDLKAEEEAIELYKEGIRVADEVNDPVTRLLFEEVLEAEEEHHRIFRDLLR